jgi:hypothetical protein
MWKKNAEKASSPVIFCDLRVFVIGSLLSPSLDAFAFGGSKG